MGKKKMLEVRIGFLTMATIILICLGFTMIGTGLFYKGTVSHCIRETDSRFIFLGLILLVVPQLGPYAICLRSKRIFTFYIYAMTLVLIVLGGYSIKCFVYNTTFGIVKNPAEETRTAKQLVGRLVPASKLARVTECIIHNHDCNFNASTNSNVWKFCCAQPKGCGAKTMFGQPGEWSWKHQHTENKVLEECSYQYCLSCRGCQLSILKAIVQQWKYLSMYSYPCLFLVCLSLAISKSVMDTFDEPHEYRGSYS